MQVQQFIAKYGDKTKVMRYKGLGEMSNEELRVTTMDPEHRILKQVNISDAAEADRIFSMLMGEDVAPAEILSRATQIMPTSTPNFAL